jgi:hypothetical protein
MAQEDIKDLGFGVLCIHTQPLFGSIISKAGLCGPAVSVASRFARGSKGFHLKKMT